MDQRHRLAAAKYVELNPVRARMTTRPENYRWSSAKAHLGGLDDALVRVNPLLEIVGDWARFLEIGLDQAEGDALRRHERIGRPLGNERFIGLIEKRIGRSINKKKLGPKFGSSDSR